MVLQIMNESACLHTLLQEHRMREPQWRHIAGNQRMEGLSTSEEVVRQVRTVFGEDLELLEWNVEFLIRPAAELSSHKCEILCTGDRQWLEVRLGHCVIRVRLDSRERYSIES